MTSSINTIKMSPLSETSIPSILSDVGAKSDFPTLHLWAFDILAVPAMSAECERIFSSAKKLIGPERNRLHEQIIEASEYLKN